VKLPDLDAYVREVIPKLRSVGTDLATVEVKAAAGGLPKSIVETVSAFSNTDGGLILLGLNEGAHFSVLDVDTAKLAADLASACADQLEPPIRPEIEIIDVDGHNIVAAIVEELSPSSRPEASNGDRSSEPSTVIGSCRPTRCTFYSPLGASRTTTAPWSMG
jgi:ATP-dependent DNA helicase RecG